MMAIRQLIHLFVAVGLALGIAVIVSNATEYIAEERDRKNAVVNDWSATDWTWEGGVLSAHIHGVKNRECRFNTSWRVSALAHVNGDIEEIAFEFLEDETPASTRPVGTQSFGWWAFKPPAGMSIEPGQITVVVAHECPEEPIVLTSIDLQYPG